MSLCRCWETSNRLRLRRRLTVVRNSSPGSNILKTNLPSTPSAIRWPITTSLGYGQSSGLQTCAGDGARGLDQVGLQHRLLTITRGGDITGPITEGRVLINAHIVGFWGRSGNLV